MKKTFDEMYRAVQKSKDSSKMIKKNRLRKPKWLKKYKSDELNRIFEKQDEFWEYGKIAFGCLVQANSRLFSMGTSDNCPANFIYTYDEYYYRNPSEFKKLARAVYALKGNADDDMNEQQKRISDMLASETERGFRLVVPNNMTGGHEVFLTTLIVERDHIPLHKLCNLFYPLLTLENDIPDAIILPGWYWRGSFACNINFQCDKSIQPFMPEDSDFFINDVFTFGTGRSFRLEHPYAFLFFTFCKILCFVMPLVIFSFLCMNYDFFAVAGIEILCGFFSCIFLGFGMISYVGSFMEQYLGDKFTRDMFGCGIFLAACFAALAIMAKNGIVPDF